jgi:hypothetical protein
MTTQVVTDLVHEKDALANELRKFQVALAAALVQFGKKKGDVQELRFAKSDLNKLSHQVGIRVLKTGGFVCEAKKVES